MSVVYSGIVKAANPTGLLPNLTPYIDQSVVSKYGFRYDPALAKSYLAKSGYHGQTLTLEVPDGWTDWMAAIQMISQQLGAVGIKVTPIFPQYAARTADLTNGNYDLAIDNNAQLDSTPWSYFQRVYELPIETQQTAQLNLERFSSPADWKLVQQAGATPVTDTATLKSIYSQLEKDFLTAAAARSRSGTTAPGSRATRSTGRATRRTGQAASSRRSCGAATSAP